MKYFLSKIEKEWALKHQVEHGIMSKIERVTQTKKTEVSSRMIAVYYEIGATEDYISAEELWMKIYSKKEFTISIATIYKYLNWLTDFGLIEQVKLISRANLYCISKQNE